MSDFDVPGITPHFEARSTSTFVLLDPVMLYSRLRGKVMFVVSCDLKSTFFSSPPPTSVLLMG